LKALMSLELAT